MTEITGLTYDEAAASGLLDSLLPDEEVQPPPAVTPADRLRAQMLHGDQILEIPQPTSVVAGWLTANSLAVAFGRPKSYKSFVALDLAACVATGTWWHGQEVDTGHVVYICAEGGSGMGARWSAWKAQNTHFGNAPRMHWLPVRVNLRAGEWANVVASAAGDHCPALVVVDTLNRTFGGGNENSPEDMSAYVAGADIVREQTGACVLVVHHSGKDEAQGARGHSALLGALDTQITVRKPADGRCEVALTEQKDGRDGATLRFGLAAHGTSLAITTSATSDDADLELTKSGAVALTALVSIAVPGGVSSTAWQETTGQPATTFFRCRKALLDRDLIENVGTDKAPRYRPTETNDGT